MTRLPYFRRTKCEIRNRYNLRINHVLAHYSVKCKMHNFIWNSKCLAILFIHPFFGPIIGIVLGS